MAGQRHCALANNSLHRKEFRSRSTPPVKLTLCAEERKECGVSRRPNQFAIEYRPLHLKYQDLARCNDACFVYEPISEQDFERYRREGFWAAYVGASLAGYGILTGSGMWAAA